MKNYGFPYKGSKNRLAEKIVKLFPDAENFYDLFCGGCAITHSALIENRWKNYVINDIDSRCPKLFFDGINGKFKNETRWISREDFFKLKDNDGYVAFCWSFGNNSKTYMYSKEIEPYKKALHYARVFNDFSLFNDFGVKSSDCSRMWIKEHHDEIKQKYILWYCKNILHSELDILELQKNLTEKVKKNSEELRQYLINGLKKSNKRPCDVDRFLGTNGMAGHYFGKSQWEFPTREVYEKLQTFICLEKPYLEIYGLQELLELLERLQSIQQLQLQQLQQLQNLERLENLQQLQRLQRLENLQQLQRLCKSYDEIEIKPNSIIYCDIPYKGTAKYNNIDFDHEAFYNWCKIQTELCFISSYDMPEDFIPIAEFSHIGSLNCKKKATIEKVFIPKHQLELYKNRLSACI